MIFLAVFLAGLSMGLAIGRAQRKGERPPEPHDRTGRPTRWQKRLEELREEQEHARNQKTSDKP